MIKETLELLRLVNLRPTSTMLELVDRSTIRPDGILKDVIILVYSWEYLVDFLVLHPRTRLGGHFLILGRPWLAIADAFINYRSKLMMISDGNTMENIILYPISKLSV